MSVASAIASATAPTTCNICIESFTKMLRKPITCPSCQAASCVQCIKRYIMESPDDPHCPSCRHGFPRTFLHENLTKSFMKGEYAARRADILWSREESFIPQYQTEVELFLRRQKYRKDVIDPLTKRRAALMDELNRLEEDIARANREVFRIGEERLGGGPAKKVTFTRKCTVPECKGWVTSAWKCGLCSNYTCSDCFVVIGEHRRGTAECTHTCTESDLATAKMIRESTRPCPKCGQGIEKREGCDQMFCTSCHTPFSWKTGEIVASGRVHNPHYFEWLQRTGGRREHGDIPCGGIPGGMYLRKFQRGYSYTCIMNIHALVAHVSDIDLAAYNTILENRDDTRNIMHDYLLNVRTKEDVKARLQQIELKKERARQFYDTLQTFVTVGAEYLRQIDAVVAPMAVASCDIKNTPAVQEIIDNMMRLVAYVNETNMVTGSLYNIQAPYIRVSSGKHYDWSSIKMSAKEAAAEAAQAAQGT